MVNERATVTDGETLDDTSTPQVETTTTQASGETPETTTAEDTQKELERLRAAVKRANADAKKDRLKAEELDKLKAEIETAKLSEKEQLEKKNADLQAKLDAVTAQNQKRLIDAEIRLQMAQLGIKSPDKVARLIDRAQITTDDDGTPTNVSELIKDLLEDIPELKGKATVSTGGGATKPSQSSSTLPPISEEYITQLVQTKEGREIYDARRAEIQKWRAQPENMFRFGR